jgi:hypothetical protein
LGHTQCSADLTELPNSSELSHDAHHGRYLVMTDHRGDHGLGRA